MITRSLSMGRAGVVTATVCILFGAFAGTSRVDGAAPKPNVLFIAIDDLRPELGLTASR